MNRARIQKAAERLRDALRCTGGPSLTHEQGTDVLTFLERPDLIPEPQDELPLEILHGG